MTDQERMRSDTTGREPAINLPWPVALLILALIAAHAARVVTGGDPDRYALTSFDLDAGRYAGVVTHQFVHGGWTHLMMNAAFILAFGAPVARYLGRGLRGGLAFFAFFLLCGAGAALAYAAYAGLIGGPGPDAPGGGPWALVGASGAASGLMAAAARLIEGRGRLGSIFGRTVMGMSISWFAINLVLGVSGLTPGAAGVPVAWQAHIFGYLCGLLLVGPLGWLAGAKLHGGPADHDNAL